MPTSEPHAYTSHLFTIRVWREDFAAGRPEWRGKLQDTRSGEADYFRAWPELVAQITAWLEFPVPEDDD